MDANEGLFENLVECCHPAARLLELGCFPGDEGCARVQVCMQCGRVRHARWEWLDVPDLVADAMDVAKREERMMIEALEARNAARKKRLARKTSAAKKARR